MFEKGEGEGEAVPLLCFASKDGRQKLNHDLCFFYFRFFSSPDQRRLEIMIGDFMKTTLPYFDVCISNTPYQVKEKNGSGSGSCRMMGKRPIADSLPYAFPFSDLVRACVQASGAPPRIPYIGSHVPT